MKARHFNNISTNLPEDAEVVGFVYKTKRFDDFNLSKFNRNINLKKDLVEQAKLGQLISPIVVNEGLTITDGQHRWLASKVAEQPIEFIVKNGLTDEDIARMNTLQKPWSMESWIEAYANEGRIEYVKLFELKQNLYKNSTQLAMVATNTTSPSTAKEILRSGNFEFYNYEKSVEFFTFVKYFFEKIQAPVRSKIVEALWEIFKVDGVDLDRLVRKVVETKLDEEIKLKSFDKGESVKCLLEAYNNRLRIGNENYIKYFVGPKAVVQIDAKKASWVK